ncbi:MAG: hypothetical protein U0996_25030 [Planctomycetaceae bacterium]
MGFNNHLSSLGNRISANVHANIGQRLVEGPALIRSFLPNTVRFLKLKYNSINNGSECEETRRHRSNLFNDRLPRSPNTTRTIRHFLFRRPQRATQLVNLLTLFVERSTANSKALQNRLIGLQFRLERFEGTNSTARRSFRRIRRVLKTLRG